MSAIALYKALIEAGAPEPSAERAVEGLPPANEVATKTDIAELCTELKTDIAALRTEMKTDIAMLEARLTWRLVIVVGIFNAILFAALRLI